MLWWKFKKFEGNELYPRGRDVQEGLRDWAKAEITRAVDAGHELGRFLFSVTTVTIAALVSVAKFTDTSVTWEFWLAIGLLAAAGVVAINLAIPNRWRLDGDTNLYEVHWSMVAFARVTSYVWVLAWLAGVVSGAVWLVQPEDPSDKVEQQGTLNKGAGESGAAPRVGVELEEGREQ